MKKAHARWLRWLADKLDPPMTPFAGTTEWAGEIKWTTPRRARQPVAKKHKPKKGKA